MAAFMAFLKPGDTFLGMDLSHGGHLTHGSPVNFSGSLYTPSSYGVHDEDGCIDYDEVRELGARAAAEDDRRRLQRVPARDRLRGVRARSRDEVGRDASWSTWRTSPGSSRPACIRRPVPHADVVTTTTHKTLRGPRGGLILCQGRAREGDRQGGVPRHAGRAAQHVIAAKAVAFKEALAPVVQDVRSAGRGERARRWRRRSSARGFELVCGGTDNHLMLVDLRSQRADGQGRGGGARPRGHHREQEHGAGGDALALRDLGHPHRHGRAHHARDEGAGVPQDRRLDRGGPCRAARRRRPATRGGAGRGAVRGASLYEEWWREPAARPA